MILSSEGTCVLLKEAPEKGVEQMSTNLLQEAAELVCLDTCHSRLDPSEIC